MKAKILFPVLLVAILISQFVSIGARAELVERIVAIVNDDMITQTDLAHFAERLKVGSLVDENLIPDEETKQALLKDPDRLLQKLIDEKIIDSEVKKQGMSVTVERVEQEIRTIAKKNNMGRDDLRNVLQERGIVFSDYQDFLKTGLERQALFEKMIISRIKVSEDDVLAAYSAQTGGQGDQAYEYTISHIFFSSDKGGLAAAHDRADAVYKKLKAGGIFDRLAAENTEDPNFEAGGLLGTFKTGELNKNLEALLLHMAPDEFSGVVSTDGGWHIVRLNKKKVIPDPRTEKEREKIRAQLYDKAYKKQMVSWLDQLRQDAFVRINPK